MIFGGLTAVALLVASPRATLAVVCAVAVVFFAATYRAPAEDGGSHREGMESSDA